MIQKCDENIYKIAFGKKLTSNAPDQFHFNESFSFIQMPKVIVWPYVFIWYPCDTIMKTIAKTNDEINTVSY